ncbi:hypothetical protein [Thermaurantimonas aggregans]|uniref:hypothetical protein n=1 Tax=Thermaurantimonas aggregans TaxID=2173829 RepID=UPI000F58A890|nr:hypothetical protein [Thermaurantimonas aggregans]
MFRQRSQSYLRHRACPGMEPTGAFAIGLAQAWSRQAPSPQGLLRHGADRRLRHRACPGMEPTGAFAVGLAQAWSRQAPSP